MKFQLVMPILASLGLSSLSYAQYLKKPINLGHLKNDKELVSEEIHAKKIKRLIRDNGGSLLESQLQSALNQSLIEFNKSSSYCDLGLVKEIDSQLAKQNLKISKDDALKILRYNNIIDDLFLKLNLNNLVILEEIQKTQNTKTPKVTAKKKLVELWDFKGLYSEFKKFPDDKSVCSLDAWMTIIQKTQASTKQLKEFNQTALALKVISGETYNKLEVLRVSEIQKMPFNLSRYLDITLFAKNKLAKPITFDNSPTDYTQDHIYRFKDMTRREALYQKFNSTEIMLMSDILVKTSKRMTAKEARLEIDYASEDYEQEIYVLAPQEIYRMSLKMLRKDLVNANSSNLFAGKEITYNDIVMSSVESGTVNFQELNEVVMFEDFWNPKVPKWKTWVNFVFQFAGTASFLLPPPYNIISAIGLVFVQTKVNRIGVKPDADDNWNAIF